MTEHRALVPSRFAEQQEVPAFAGSHNAGTTPATTVFTPRRRAKFCDQLAHHGNVRLAAKAAGVSPQTAYRARRSCLDFAACWDAALVLARDVAEQVLADRAINGVEEAVYYHGEEVATRRRYDSRLLLAHLARLDARVERDRQEQGGAEALASEFDHALGRLEAGEQVARPRGPSADDAGGGAPDGEGLPPVEAALRWLEAQRGVSLHDWEGEGDWPEAEGAEAGGDVGDETGGETAAGGGTDYLSP